MRYKIILNNFSFSNFFQKLETMEKYLSCMDIFPAMIITQKIIKSNIFGKEDFQLRWLAHTSVATKHKIFHCFAEERKRSGMAKFYKRPSQRFLNNTDSQTNVGKIKHLQFSQYPRRAIMLYSQRRKHKCYNLNELNNCNNCKRRVLRLFIWRFFLLLIIIIITILILF